MKSASKILLIFAALATLAFAADKPDYSGDWKMNVAKSSFGPLPPPATYTRKVTQTPGSITFEDNQTGTAAGGDQHDKRTYMTDGTEISYQANGADIKSALTWDGDALQINSKASVQGMDIAIKEQVSLGDAGKTMTDTVHVATGQGDLDITVVFEKQ